MINKYKHIIWDWNGTLLNDVDFCKNIINRILIENNLPELSLAKYKEVFSFPVEDYYKAAGLDFNKKSFEILGKDFIDEYEQKKYLCSLFDGVEELLLYIHQNNVKQSVLSAYKHDNLLNILNSYKLIKYFDNVIGSDNIYAAGKTHLGLKLIKELDIDKNEILFIGDTLHDYEVAEAMGVNSILIANGHQAKEKLQTSSTIVLDDLIALKKHLGIK